MPVITVSRQYGSGGAFVGRALAERLGAQYLDREVLALVAERAGIPEAEAEGYDERLPGLWQRLAAALAASGPEISVPPVPHASLPGTAVGERLAAFTRVVIQEAAERGDAVIVGRGAAFILGRVPGTLHVQLHASLEARVRYVLSAAEEIPDETLHDEASLRELCQRIDEARARFIKRHFNVDWNDSRHYDLCLDTGRLGLGNAADLIESAAARITGDEPASATDPGASASLGARRP